MEPSGDLIAELILDNFDTWERKRKPLDRSGPPRQSGQASQISQEWVPLSGIVAYKDGKGTCIASATGMKCLPRDKIPKAQGIVVHDWHAEVLALRSLNRFLLEECLDLAQSCKDCSEYIRFRSAEEMTETHFQPFALQDGVSLHMYCSEAPCGDASMELTMAAQEDSTPWTNPTPLAGSKNDELLLHGRGYFSDLGAVRRKPSRPDAPPTLSKSCSDKISVKQATSILSSIASLIISPQNCYIKSLTLSESQYSEIACTRAFSSTGRLAPLFKKNWQDGYEFMPFNINTTTLDFKHSRRQALQPNEVLVPSNIASLWTPRNSETIISGTQQGRKQFSIQGASLVSKRRMWRLARMISIQSALSKSPSLVGCLEADTYVEVKNCGLLGKREEVKNDVRGVLKGWQRNIDGETWDCSGVKA